MKRPAVWIAMALFAIAALIIGYRVVRLGYPLLPTANIKVWHFEMEMAVKADVQDVNLRIGLPVSRIGEEVTEERVTSGKLGFKLVREGSNLFGIWSGSSGRKGETIGYQATILVTTPRSKRIKPRHWNLILSRSGWLKRSWPGVSWPNGALSLPWKGFRQSGRPFKANGGDPMPNRKDLETWSSVVAHHGQKNALLALLRASRLPRTGG